MIESNKDKTNRDKWADIQKTWYTDLCKALLERRFAQVLYMRTLTTTHARNNKNK